MSDQIDWPPSTPHHFTVPVPPARPPRNDQSAEENGADTDALPGLVCREVFIHRPDAPALVAVLEAPPEVARRLPARIGPLDGRQLSGLTCIACGARLGRAPQAAGVVRQAAPVRDITYQVGVCADRCRLPARPVPPSRPSSAVVQPAGDGQAAPPSRPPR